MPKGLEKRSNRSPERGSSGHICIWNVLSENVWMQRGYDGKETPHVKLILQCDDRTCGVIKQLVE